MDAQRWQQVEEVFLEAAEHTGAARTAFLAAACAGDAALRQEVESLLAAEDDVPNFLDDLPDWPQGLAGAAPETGREVGPYQLLHELGRGGMGVVFLAERADVGLQAAVKLVHSAWARPAHRRRLEQERRVLARLAHPHIARLFDAGFTDEGTPYFVMEYVEGQPLTDYCTHHALPLKARLRLFVDVCRAVAYAHQSLVVHRDLKPSNILVAEGEAGQPVVKLLDFGIAKLLDEEDEAGLTQTSEGALTPAYAAPEQVLGEPTTTATDVYSLGVLLYELIVGRHPYAQAGASVFTVSQAVLKAQALRPSAAAPFPQARRLQGDLDTLVMKAMHRQPAHRYASAEALAQDLERFMGGHPIAARGDALGYRVRKFIQRNRMAVAAAVVAVLLLSGGMLRERALRAEAEGARDAATQATREAEEVSDFLLSLFDVSDPLSNTAVRGDTLQARTLLARGAERVRRDLSHQPVVQAQMLQKIGEVYINLGLYAEAEVLLAEALRAQQQAALAPATQAETVAGLATAHWHQGAYADAEHAFRDALRLDSTTTRLKTPRHAMLLNNLGSVVQAQGRNQEAEALHQEALALRQHLLGPTHADIAISLNDLAFALRAQGRLEEAETAFREAAAHFAQTAGPGHPYVIYATSNLAMTLLPLGRAAEAEALLREVMAQSAEVFAPDHPLQSRWRSNWAATLIPLGRYAEAEAALLEAYQQLLDARGPDHFHVREARAALAALYEAWGRPEAATAWR